MLDDYIQGHEKLYRAINSLSFWWDEEHQRPSSAAFKDKRGTSVDRQGNRTNLDEIIGNIKKYYESRLKAIVSITARKCREINTYPKYSRGRNEYHSIIQESVQTIMISEEKAFLLSRLVKVERQYY